MGVSDSVLGAAKSLAAKIRTPALVIDSSGNVAFYNTAAETLLGATFAERGPLTASAWFEETKVRSPEGEPLPLEAMAGWVGVQRERPATGSIKFNSLQGEEHLVRFIVNPLFRGKAASGQFEGVLVLYWKEEERQPDRRLATVVYTDIVSSTERASQLGDAQWLRLLHHHDQVVRRCIEDHQGQLISTAGDGAVLTFDVPARAIAFGRSLRRRLADRGLEIRVGIHSGEIAYREEGEIGGIAVHIGARVLAAARPGEILVSRTVTDLVAGSDLNFEDRGEHQLKGVPGRWQLFAVSRPDQHRPTL